MNQADVEYIQGMAQDILEHSGVKGMKWGVRRARNALTNLNVASRNKHIEKSANKLGVKSAASHLGKAVSGDGLSTLRTVAGTGLHRYAQKGSSKLIDNANIMNFYNNKSAVKAVARNAKTAAKLRAKHAKATDPKKKEKAKKELDAWNAYTKQYNRKLSKNVKDSNSAFSRADSNRAAIDRNRAQTIKKINSKVYGKNKHGDTNKVLDYQYKSAQELVNAGKDIAKSVTPAQVRGAVALAGRVSGQGAHKTVDSAKYVRAAATRRKVKPAYKDQSTRYKTI